MNKLCHEGVVSIKGFLVGAALLLIFLASDLLVVLDLGNDLIANNFSHRLTYLALWFVAINIFLWLKAKASEYQILWRAVLLGLVFSIGLTTFTCAPDNWRSFGIYLMFLSLFHYTEYLAIAINSPKSLSVDSFILNHSTSYHIAAIASWIEFAVEIYYFPKMKSIWFIWIVGTVLCLGGEIVRKIAMWNASHNFTHIVRFEHVDDHRLVKHGAFAYVRHPSYVGWFYWSIGTQVILANPICFVLYAIASWKFFNERIYMEEITLLNFFGEEYYKYQQAVPTGLPFIRGYKVEL